MTKVYFKGFLNALLFTLISMHSLAQLAPGQKWNEFTGDSLLGFDESELRSFAYGENLSVQATNSYLYNQKRFFIYQKYNYEKFSFSIIENLVHLKYDIINLDKDQLLYKIREERNKIIASTDWTQFADIVLPEYDKYRYLVYRKALRDVPNKYLQSGKIEWPTL